MRSVTVSMLGSQIFLFTHGAVVAKLFLKSVDGDNNVIDVRLVEKIVTEILQTTLNDDLLNLVIQTTEGVLLFVHDLIINTTTFFCFLLIAFVIVFTQDARMSTSKSFCWLFRMC